MAPIADAVGFIHRQRHELALIMQILQQLAAGLTLQALRGEIQQPQRALLNLLLQLAQLLQRQPVMQTSRGDAAAAQLGHLVLHQGDQWRNHKHHPTAHQGRQLITKRLPRPRRQNSQAITALQQGLNHLALTGTKVAVTEVLLQRLQQRCTGFLHPRTVPVAPRGARPQAACCSGGASS